MILVIMCWLFPVTFLSGICLDIDSRSIWSFLVGPVAIGEGIMVLN